MELTIHYELGGGVAKLRHNPGKRNCVAEPMGKHPEQIRETLHFAKQILFSEHMVDLVCPRSPRTMEVRSRPAGRHHIAVTVPAFCHCQWRAQAVIEFDVMSQRISAVRTTSH